MEDNCVYKIGGSAGESSGISYAFGQIFLLFVCFLFILLSIALTVIDLANIQFVIAWILLCVLLLFVFSKIYHIEYDADWFYLKRLFYKTQQISVDDFLEVRRRVFPFGYVYVVFKDKKVLTMGNSKDVFTLLFMTSNKEYNKKYTAEVKMNIEKARTQS